MSDHESDGPIPVPIPLRDLPRYALRLLPPGSEMMVCRMLTPSSYDADRMNALTSVWLQMTQEQRDQMAAGRPDSLRMACAACGIDVEVDRSFQEVMAEAAMRGSRSIPMCVVCGYVLLEEMRRLNAELERGGGPVGANPRWPDGDES